MSDVKSILHGILEVIVDKANKVLRVVQPEKLCSCYVRREVHTARNFRGYRWQGQQGTPSSAAWKVMFMWCQTWSPYSTEFHIANVRCIPRWYTKSVNSRLSLTKVWLLPKYAYFKERGNNSCHDHVLTCRAQHSWLALRLRILRPPVRHQSLFVP